MKSGVVRFTVSVNPDLLDDFDLVVDRMGYSRSNALRARNKEFVFRGIFIHMK